jgi:MmgE/PrpD N-terminal domain
MRDHGLDHVFYTAVASAVGAVRVLGLDHGRIAQAVALAVTPNGALHATRRGELSMWKGVAAGQAARNGVFAALRAAEGTTRASMYPMACANCLAARPRYVLRHKYRPATPRRVRPSPPFLRPPMVAAACSPAPSRTRAQTVSASE